ncbi:MAG: Senescence marker protein-30 [Mucilaginibacter sp.]|nr:Senescence marker protein-30 [Mucilaginibacter sp.]
MKNLKAKLEIGIECALGEGPLWHPTQQKLYWVDIEQGQIYSYDPIQKNISVTRTYKPVSALVPVNDKILLIALRGEMAQFNTETKKIETLTQMESHLPENRCNDGKCDLNGRFWIGTMGTRTLFQQGSLYRITADLSISKVLDQLTIANGLDWSPDGRTMYFIDSFERTVRVYDFEAGSGKLSNGRTILKIGPEESPDGLCVDSEGMLWIAFWGGGRIGRYHPVTCEHLAHIAIPALNVTSCTFGGKDLTTLFITTARTGLSSSELMKYPRSGSLFSCKTGVKGLPANFFNLSNNHLSK